MPFQIANRIDPSPSVVAWPLSNKNNFVRNAVPENWTIKSNNPWNLFISPTVKVIHFHWIEYLFAHKKPKEKIKYLIFSIIIVLLRLRGRKLVHTFHNIVPNQIYDFSKEQYISNYSRFLSKMDCLIYMNSNTLLHSSSFGIHIECPTYHVWHGFLYDKCSVKPNKRSGFGVFGSGSKYKNNTDLAMVEKTLAKLGEEIEFFGDHWKKLKNNVISEKNYKLEHWLANKKFIIVTNRGSLNSGVIWHAIGCGANILLTNKDLLASLPIDLQPYINLFEENKNYNYTDIPLEIIEKYGKAYVHSKLKKIYEEL